MDCELKGQEHVWRTVWFKALTERLGPVNLYQCTKCMKVLMATEEYIFE